MAGHPPCQGVNFEAGKLRGVKLTAKPLVERAKLSTGEFAEQIACGELSRPINFPISWRYMDLVLRKQSASASQSVLSVSPNRADNSKLFERDGNDARMHNKVISGHASDLFLPS